MLRLWPVIGFLLVAISASAQVVTEEERLQQMQRTLEALQQRLAAARAEQEVLRISGWALSVWSNRCEFTMRLTQNLPNVRVVNMLSGTAEVVNAGRVSVERFLFQEAELGNPRQITVSTEGACENPTMRIMRITLCEVDGKLYDNCGEFLRAAHPFVIAPQAMRQ
jgi:type II secretory pathway pseudopilin PulG